MKVVVILLAGVTIPFLVLLGLRELVVNDNGGGFAIIMAFIFLLLITVKEAAVG